MSGTGFLVEQAESILKVSGELTRHTINKKNQFDLQKKLNKSNAIVDLLQVKKIDTAGLAWLLSLVEYSELNTIDLNFTNVSDDLLKLTELTGVSPYLPCIQT